MDKTTQDFINSAPPFDPSKPMLPDYGAQIAFQKIAMDSIESFFNPMTVSLLMMCAALGITRSKWYSPAVCSAVFAALFFCLMTKTLES